MNLSNYSPIHSQELSELIKTEPWPCILQSKEIIDQAKLETIAPPRPRSPEGDVVEQLKALNEEKVKALIKGGIRDKSILLKELSTWPIRWQNGQKPKLSFLGICLTTDCNFSPKCIYCNQRPFQAIEQLEVWKRAIDEITESGSRIGALVYLTGGEPLLLKEKLCGRNGLIRYAAERKAVINLNTNATLITPEVAIGFIASGLAKLHISLDAGDPNIQNSLVGENPVFNRIVRGIYNVQIARELIGVDYPKIHINCVMTNKNLLRFPELLSFLLERRKIQGEVRDELGVHLIPVGGESNVKLRPTHEELKHFYLQTWQETDQLWNDYQAKIETPPDKRRLLKDHFFFTSSYFRVAHRGSLDDYIENSTKGIYSELALIDRCYVAPTQAFLLPNGDQHWCGAHVNSHPKPLGNVQNRGICENIISNVNGLEEFPSQYCRNCATATLAINQSVQRSLNKLIDEWEKQSVNA